MGLVVAWLTHNNDLQVLHSIIIILHLNFGKINCKFKDQDFHIAELSYLCNQNCHYPSNINNVLSQLSIQYCITIQAVKLIIIYLVLVMNGHSGNSAVHCL